MAGCLRHESSKGLRRLHAGKKNVKIRVLEGK